MTKRIVLMTFLAGVLALGFAQWGLGPAVSTANLLAPLSLQAKDALLEALMGPVGEYAAYATYDAVIQKYGAIEPYVSIRDSEAQHIAALQRQLEKYGVAYPTTNPYLGKIKLPSDLKAIAETEVNTELENAAMYGKLLAAVSGYPDLTRVFENLKRASLVAHLNFFKAAAEQGGSLSVEQMQAVRLQVESQMWAQGAGRGQGGPNFQKCPDARPVRSRPWSVWQQSNGRRAARPQMAISAIDPPRAEAPYKGLLPIWWCLQPRPTKR